jgi:hypothetical protein
MRLTEAPCDKRVFLCHARPGRRNGDPPRVQPFVIMIRPYPSTEGAMAKGQMRPQKEKKKPKKNKDKKKGGPAPSPFAPGQSPTNPAYNPYAKKT